MLKFALKNMAIKKMQVILIILSIVISAGIAVLAFNVATQVDEGITNNAGYYSAIVGPAGSNTQLAMNTMYFTDEPVGTIPYSVVTALQRDSRVTSVIPFAFTNQAINVVGTLEVAENEDEPFTDLYGYEFNFKIVDATYTVIQADELSADMALWQKVAESDVVTDIYAMYDYVNFLCAWNTYFVNPGTDEDGNTIPGYYLYPADATYYITTDGAQYNYGYKDGYFDDIVKKIEAVDPTAFADLVANVRSAQALAEKALAELENENYTYEKQYIEQFDIEDFVYTLNIGEELAAEMEALYSAFSNWLGSWEM